MNARADRKRNRSRRSQYSSRTVFLGVGIAVVAAFIGLRFGQDLGYIVLLIAGAIGAVLARSLSGATSSRPAASEGQDPQTDGSGADGRPRDNDGAGGNGAAEDLAPDPPARVSLFAEPGPGEPDWPVETQEVRLKLDLAKEYLGVDEPELATHLLNEVLELEIAAARKLAVEILQDTSEGSVDTTS